MNYSFSQKRCIMISKKTGELGNRLRGRGTFDPKPDADNAAVGSHIDFLQEAEASCFFIESTKFRGGLIGGNCSRGSRGGLRGSALSLVCARGSRVPT